MARHHTVNYHSMCWPRLLRFLKVIEFQVRNSANLLKTVPFSITASRAAEEHSTQRYRAIHRISGILGYYLGLKGFSTAHFSEFETSQTFGRTCSTIGRKTHATTNSLQLDAPIFHVCWEALQDAPKIVAKP